MSSNPLSQYFRQPAIYIRLPSQGNFYPEGALDMPVNSELPVLPMTTLDEITYRTPDALFNGQSTVSVIQSCIPNIKNAWAVPAMDIDTLLIAIRIATYGHELDIETTCPKCEHEEKYGVDLRTLLENIKAPDYSQSLRHGDLEIFFRPMNYQNINENSLAQFEEQKSAQMLEDSTADEAEKSRRLSEILRKMTDVTTNALAKSISVIRTPQALVNNSEHIQEWLSNCDRKLFSLVRDHIVNTKQSGEIQPLKITCQNCKHTYDQIFTMNPSDFFEDAS